MPKPIDPKYTQGETEWSGPGFVRWLAADYPDLAHLTPHLLRPAGQVESKYIGGLYGKNEPELREEHFAGHWRTGYGRLAVVYPRHHAFSPRRALEHLSQADTVVMVHADWSIYGLPNLVAVDRARPELEYEPRWSEVAAHVGAPVPWWPADLRRREHLTTWSPGKKPAAVEVVTWPSWEPLYDMALREAQGTPVRVACFSLGHEMRRRAVEHVDWEIGQMNGDDDSDSSAFAKRRAAQRDSMVIPAFPDRTDPGASEAEDEESIREGVAQLWRRTDELAVECLEQIAMWSGAYMPFGGSFSVNTADATPAGREWVRRVQKSEPTAIHQVWESEIKEVTGTFTDPVTGAPVITKKGYYMFRPSDEVTFHSYAPRRQRDQGGHPGQPHLGPRPGRHALPGPDDGRPRPVLGLHRLRPRRPRHADRPPPGRRSRPRPHLRRQRRRTERRTQTGEVPPAQTPDRHPPQPPPAGKRTGKRTGQPQPPHPPAPRPTRSLLTHPLRSPEKAGHAGSWRQGRTRRPSRAHPRDGRRRYSVTPWPTPGRGRPTGEA
ncbi:hypothetical protein OG978_46270 (plasmid) [Streptomyces sp. NBC_01591]|uniref:hypothetical protein n=1 Tax=Streptomyces sp. NBC_01591 TaxID=2975888 RepID=UPI002DDA7E73|nr:hypothetical protein [Streptomyces sp. NBC_01591]WSD74438.1 hypothetical protein OG978_46270 [Streptomyces sp. NBC_01591]